MEAILRSRYPFFITYRHAPARVCLAHNQALRQYYVMVKQARSEGQQQIKSCFHIWPPHGCRESRLKIEFEAF